MGWLITPSMKTPFATGGDSVYNIFVNGTTYRVHEFRTVGTSNFIMTRGESVEYLVVGGGGGGSGIVIVRYAL